MSDQTKFKGYLPEYPFKPGAQIGKINDIFLISKKASDEDIFNLGRIREPLADEEIELLKKAFETLYVAGIKHKLSLTYSEDLSKWTWADLLGAARTLNAQAEPDKKQPAGSISYEAQALAMFTKNPDLTNKQIAKALGVHVKTLSRYESLKDARSLLKQRSLIPRGQKNREGDIEAWDDR